jgi:hypothetical protein
MADESGKICFDRIIPPQYEAIALQKARAENPANVVEPRSAFEAAVQNFGSRTERYGYNF